MRLVLVLLLLLLPLLASSEEPLRPRPQSFRGTQWSANATHTELELSHVRPLHLDEWLQALEANAARRQRRAGVGAPVQKDAFWEFIPSYMGSVKAGERLLLTAPTVGPAPCRTTSVTAESMSTGHARLVFTATGTQQTNCSDFWGITTVGHIHLETVAAAGSKTVLWDVLEKLSPLEQRDIAAEGFRVFHFSVNEEEAMASVFETVQLFLEPEILPGVSRATAQRNIKFLRDYMPGGLGPHFGEERLIKDVVPDASEVKDGDLFCILRLDGLDPLINWGTGGNCGHNVMALTVDGELCIVESQSKGAYWPKDYVQRNKFADWIKMAKRADYNVVWLPLSAASRARFNATAAEVAFKRDFEGLLCASLALRVVAYHDQNIDGFPNMLWGWFDSADSNFPPPLDIHLVTTLFSLVDPLLKTIAPTTPSLWNGAIAQRLGLEPSENYTTAGLLNIARQRENQTFGDLLAMPEKDSWIYPLASSSCGRPQGCTGPAQVCNVFVCKMWKVGGMFEVDFDCGEQVPLDTYQMALFGHAPQLSERCKLADPTNTHYCQILGDYRMELPHFNKILPFTGMRKHCPSQAPNYPMRFAAEVEKSC